MNGAFIFVHILYYSFADGRGKQLYSRLTTVLNWLDDSLALMCYAVECGLNA